jgi:hypothetical protein
MTRQDCSGPVEVNSAHLHTGPHRSGSAPKLERIQLSKIGSFREPRGDCGQMTYVAKLRNLAR